MADMTWESPLKGVERELARLGHPVWEEIEDHFSVTEFKRPYEMDVAFLRWLFQVRVDAGCPFSLISDARAIDGDVGADKSAHKKRPCRAVDVIVKNSWMRGRIVIAAIRNGCVRLGTYPAKKKSLHLDCEDHEDNPSPRIWTKY